MSCEYVDVVTVHTAMYGKRLRVAPFMSNLKIGDKVMIQVDFNPWEIPGTVEDIATFNTEREEFKLLRSFVGLTNRTQTMELDLKVTKRLEYFSLWDEDEYEEGELSDG